MIKNRSLMKKLTTLILTCATFGIFAQQSTIDYNLENDNYQTRFELAVDVNGGVVYTSPNTELNEIRDGYSSNFAVRGMPEYELIHMEEDILIDAKKMGFGEGMVTFSKDKKTVFFSVNRKIKNSKGKNEREVKIKKSVMLHLFKADVNENGNWTNIEMLPFNSNQYSIGHPVLNQNDTKLYFVSDGPGSIGRTDIFVVDLHKDGTYGSPKNLGSKINSKEREIFPFINKDNLLVFSSDAFNKEGNLDVFASKIFDNTMSTPLKLMGSLNVEYDDFTYNIDDKEHLRYFSTNNLSGKKVDEMYALIETSPININCFQEITGVVKNIDTNELLSNVEIKLFDNNNIEMISLVSNEMDGSFSFNQSCNGTYKLKGYLEGYLMEEIEIKTINDLDAKPIQIVMNMEQTPFEEIEIMALEDDSKDTNNLLVESSKIEITENSLSNEDTLLSREYNFKSDNQVFTVQIGAFKGKAQTNKYNFKSGYFNHLYNDGFNRYYSGVFKTRMEAMNYLKQLRDNGYQDAYVVGLRGENRF